MNGNIKRSSTTARIEMEYADGRVVRLVGEAAEAWAEEYCDLLCIDLIRRGGNRLSGTKWQEIMPSTGRSQSSIRRFDGRPVSTCIPAASFSRLRRVTART